MAQMHWGLNNTIIQPHELYLTLGKTPDERQVAYRGLFESAIHPDELDLIRASLHSGTPLGNDRFKQQIESVVGGTVGFSKRGRPLTIKFSSKVT
jgi:putative transposase